ncbi:MAG: 50S ribosomal protein L4 [Proteobacteria bacterium]|nr:50S ribosomal protein L4 [Pseudomonadota bacterium]
MNFDILTLEGKKSGSLALSPAVFGVEVRADLLQRAVNWQLDARRAGLANTLTRGEIDRSKKKVYAQKKTGGARHGAKSPSLFVGGGVVFGPRPRDFSTSLPKKVRMLALKTALSSKAAGKNLIIIDEAAVKSAKTKDLAKSLEKLGALNATFIIDSVDTNFDRASRNLPLVKVIPTSGANVYDILHHEKLVITSKAVEMLSARLGTEEKAKPAAKAAKAAKPAAKKTTKVKE